MISYPLMAWCFGVAGAYLLVVSVLWFWLGKVMNITKGIPEDLLEPTGLSLYVVNFLTEFVFFAAVPAMIYSFLYVVLPFDGVRAAVAVALLVFTLGAVPILMGITVRLKLSMPYLLFYLLGYFIKMAGSLIIIGYIYLL